MPSWITIYLQNEITAIDLTVAQQGVSPADWHTLGEDFDIEDDDVSEFMAKLRWDQAAMEIGIQGERPIQIHIWNEVDRIAEEISELTDMPAPVAGHMTHVKSIVALEFGIPQARTMVEVVAFELAYWLAETQRGVIHSYTGDWYDHDEHRWQPFS